MPPNSEIEKLERRWKENPKGTVFAPYAEVLRKHGDHILARDILRQGLELHPDHIPGNIVLGRCCLDLREDGPAEAAFTHVLDLDAENVIALKALADITERQGRLMEAASWLTRLIAVDPSNDEARDQLGRVEATREAAALALTAPLTHSGGQAPEPVRAADVTETLPLVPRSSGTGSASTLPTVEVAAGQILEEDTDLALDARFGAIQAPPADPPPTPGTREPEVTTEVVAKEVPPTPAGLPLALDVVDLGDGGAATPPDEPELVLERASGDNFFAIDQVDSGAIDIRPSGATEFQVPDASTELMLTSSGGAEYQTPSGSEELLRMAESAAAAAAAVPSRPEPPPPEAAAPDGLRPVKQVITTGFAAITLMPTQELPTEPPDAPMELIAPEPESIESAEAASMLVELEPEPMVAEQYPEVAAVETESLLDMLAAAAAPAPLPIQPAPAPIELAAEAVPAQPSDHELKLIFPEDAAAPEPPRKRRISKPGVQPASQPAERELPEPGVLEPAPVMTESMAELYVRQGHLSDAIRVYQALVERTPHDERLQEKVRSLQAALGGGSRRLSYVAVDTGGESVESFFRSLADARPAGAAAQRQLVDGQRGGAPTRPTNDPLSLSAIFGEAHSDGSANSAGSEPAGKPSTPDAFSFDQFFGGSLSGGGAGGAGGGRLHGEDLDQFQHWLKSLKK